MSPRPSFNGPSMNKRLSKYWFPCFFLLVCLCIGCSEPETTYEQQEVEFIPGSIQGEAAVLFDAVDAGDIAGVIKTVESGVDVNSQDDRGATPLHIAAYRGEVEIAEYLLTQGADPELANDDGLTPLETAEYVRHALMVTILGKAIGTDSGVIPDGDLSIWDCARSGDLTGLEFHLSGDLDINVPLDLKDDVAFGGSALHVAVMEFSNAAVLYLIDRGADVDLPANTKHKGTPLHWAVRAANDEAVKALLNAGADLQMKDANGKLPIDWLDQAPSEAEIEIGLIRELLSEPSGTPIPVPTSP